MAIKKTVKTLDGLPEEVAKLYVKDGDTFVLSIEGEEDNGALKRALEREREAAKQAKAELKELSTRLENLEGDAAKAKAKAGDVTALEESYRKKLADTEQRFKAEIEQRDGFIRQTLVDNVASGIAREISNAPDLLVPHLLRRLTVDIVDGKPVTRVLDAQGKPSASTPEELAKEFVANPTFGPVIIASKAAGGSAKGGGQGGGATLDAYRNEKGEVQWGKLASDAQKDPSLLKLVQTSET